MNQRVEREIEEILSRSGDFGRSSAKPTYSRDSRKWQPGSLGRGSAFWTKLGGPGQAMLLALALGILAYILQFRFPLLATMVTLIAVAFFVAAYVQAWRGPKNISSEHRWRGQVIDYKQGAAGDLGLRLRRWWNKVSRR